MHGIFNEVLVRIVAADALMLKHQAISIHNTHVYLLFDKF